MGGMNPMMMGGMLGRGMGRGMGRGGGMGGMNPMMMGGTGCGSSDDVIPGLRMVGRGGVGDTGGMGGMCERAAIADSCGVRERAAIADVRTNAPTDADNAPKDAPTDTAPAAGVLGSVTAALLARATKPKRGKAGQTDAKAKEKAKAVKPKAKAKAEAVKPKAKAKAKVLKFKAKARVVMPPIGQRVLARPRGCSKCRGKAGCTPSCWRINTTPW